MHINRSRDITQVQENTVCHTFTATFPNNFLIINEIQFFMMKVFMFFSQKQPTVHMTRLKYSKKKKTLTTVKDYSVEVSLLYPEVYKDLWYLNLKLIMPTKLEDLNSHMKLWVRICRFLSTSLIYCFVSLIYILFMLVLYVALFILLFMFLFYVAVLYYYLCS